VTTGVYVRWKRGEPRETKVTPPLVADHPLAGFPCLVCGINLFGGADSPRDVALIALGPEPDEREEKGNGADRWYTAVGLPLHASCALPGHVEGVLTQ
jgi:hypothetical protein